MGFLDKAKQMAEQAQQKLDEVQKDFNAKQSGSAMGAGTGGPAVEYDKFGRPIQAQAPAGDGPAPAVDPQGAAATEPPVAPPAPVAPSVGFEPAVTPDPAPAAPAAPAAPSGDPLAQAPAAPSAPAEDATPGLTSGDPLAG